MPQPTILSTRNGSGSVSGYRDDLVAGDLVGLSLSNYVGITSVKWELIGRPEGSAAGGAGPEPILLATANSTAFNVDSDSGDFRLDGTYDVQATLNPGTPGQIRITAILCRLSGLTIPGPGSTVRTLRKLGGFETLEDTSVPTILQGWATELNRWLELLRETVTGGAGGFTTLAGAYSHGADSSDQTMVLHDSLGGGIIVDGSQSNFTGASALRINTAAGGPVVVDRATGRVGIGIAAPLQSLHAKGAAPALRLDRTGGATLDAMNVADDLQLLNGATILGIFKSTGGLQADLGVGIGTPPATHPVLALGAASTSPISASGTARFRYNESTGHAEFSENGGAYQPFGTSAASAYATIDAAGTPLTQRTILNFVGPLTPVDNSGATRTDVSIAANGITTALFRQSVALSVVGNPTGSTANAQDIVAGADGQFLGRTGGALAWSAVPYSSLTGAPTIFYQTVEEAGSALTQRTILNFDGTVVASDSASPARTNVGLPAVGPGAGTIGGFGITSITLDAQGRVTGASTGTFTSGGITSLVGDGTATGPGAATFILTNIPDQTTAAGSVLFADSVAPALPALGFGALYADAASKNIAFKNNAGAITHGVKTFAAVGGQFLTAIDDDGTVHSATATTTVFYQTVDAAGVPLTQRPTLNAVAPLTAVDNSGAARTDLGLSFDGTLHVSGGALGVLAIPGSSVTGIANTVPFLNGSGVLAEAVNALGYDPTNVRFGSRVSSGLPLYQVHLVDEAGASDRGLAVASYSTSSTPARRVSIKARGTFASPTSVALSDYLLRDDALAFDGTSYLNTAATGFYVDNTPSTGHAGSAWYIAANPTGLSSDPVANNEVSMYAFSNGRISFPKTPAAVQSMNVVGMSGGVVANNSKLSTVSAGSVQTFYAGPFTGTAGGITAGTYNTQIGGSSTWPGTLSFVNVDSGRNTTDTGMAFFSPASNVFTGTAAGIYYTSEAYSGALGSTNALVLDNFQNYGSSPTGRPIIFVGWNGGAQFRAMYLPGDGSTLWGNSTAAVSASGTAGIRSAGGHLQYSQNGGAWTNFDAALTGAFYQTVEEAGTPLAQRSILNFDGTVVATDSASPARTNVGLPATGPGAGTIGGAGIASITLDAQGRVTGATTGSFGAGGYTTLEANGTPVTARAIASFSVDFGVVDNGGATRTDITLANAGAGAGLHGGAGVSGVTLDAKGRVTAVGTATYLIGTGASPGTFNNVTITGDGLVTGGSNVAYLTSAFYQTVEEAGSALTQRAILNFDGTVVAADDVAHARTNVGLPNVGPGAGLQGGAGISGIVLDAQGRVVSVNAATYQGVITWPLSGQVLTSAGTSANPTGDSTFTFNQVAHVMAGGNAIGINGATVFTNTSLVVGITTAPDRDRVQFNLGGGTLGPTGTGDSTLFDIIPADTSINGKLPRTPAIYSTARIRSLTYTGGSLGDSASVVTSLYIDGAPATAVMGGGEYAVYAAGGQVHFGGDLEVGGDVRGALLIAQGSGGTPLFADGNLFQVGFFGASPVGQQAGGSASAGVVYTATEQGMLNRAYAALRAFGLLA